MLLGSMFRGAMVSSHIACAGVKTVQRITLRHSRLILRILGNSDIYVIEKRGLITRYALFVQPRLVATGRCLNYTVCVTGSKAPPQKRYRCHVDNVCMRIIYLLQRSLVGDFLLVMMARGAEQLVRFTQ